MSWDQDYSVPSYLDLLVKLTGKNLEELLMRLTSKNPEKLLEQELEKQGLKVVNTEEVVLDNGYFQVVHGLKVTLSDGRVFVPKLVQRHTANGNYGCDYYEYVLENENPEIRHTDADDEIGDPQIEPGLDDPDHDGWSNEGGYGGCDGDGCGCGF